MTLRRLRPAVPLVVPTVHGWWLLALALALGVSWRLTDLGLMRSAAVLLACLAAVAALGALLLGAASRSLVRIAGPDQVVAGESGRWQAVLAPRIPPWVQGELRMRVGGLGASLSLFAPPPGPTAPDPPAPTPGALAPAPAPGSAGGRLAPARRRERVADVRVDADGRGLLPLEARTLVLHEPLGLMSVRRRAVGALDVVVLPERVEVPAALAPALDRGPARERDEEQGELRDYRPGDSLATIHWKQSARIDRLLVTSRQRLGLVRRRLWFDPRPGSYADRAEQELALAAAASVLDSWNDGAARLELRIGARAHRAAPGRAVELIRVLALLDLGALPAAAAVEAADADRSAPEEAAERTVELLVTGSGWEPARTEEESDADGAGVPGPRDPRVVLRARAGAVELVEQGARL
ncbi:DUF58 domain-containing protein [Actinomyces dentalis]|uniref:DUF58 domain-containing protein n=2 Tax=Actinomyces dentalis TaxID=272548 RepID=UPI0004242871|nr:DUF58 domain-containing protein [Actinomyces dentalis]